MYDTHALDMAANPEPGPNPNPNRKHAAESGCTPRGVGCGERGEDPSALELA